MPYTGPINVEEVIEALIELGNEADVLSIKERVIKQRGGVPLRYKDEHTCKETIQAIIEKHCPESANYRENQMAYFSRVERGLYRLLPEKERGFKEKQYEVRTCKPTFKRSSAVEMMAAYYSANKQMLPKSISNNREEIIRLLMQGLNVEDAFNRFV